MSTPSNAWSAIVVSGHACQLYDPPEGRDHGYAAIYLHDRPLSGGEEDALSPALRKVIEQRSLPTIVPRTPDAWWLDCLYPPFDRELTAERFVADHVTRFVAERWHITTPQLALWGVGTGGQGALRLAYRRPHQFPIVAAILPTIDFHRDFEAGDQALRSMFRDAEQARQDTATLHIHPLNWPRNQWFCGDSRDYFAWEGVDRLRMKLSSLGVPHVCPTDALAEKGANYLQWAASEAMAFLWERLDFERRRVV